MSPRACLALFPESELSLTSLGGGGRVPMATRVSKLSPYPSILPPSRLISHPRLLPSPPHHVIFWVSTLSEVLLCVGLQINPYLLDIILSGSYPF